MLFPLFVLLLLCVVADTYYYFSSVKVLKTAVFHLGQSFGNFCFSFDIYLKDSGVVAKNIFEIVKIPYDALPKENQLRRSVSFQDPKETMLLCPIVFQYINDNPTTPATTSSANSYTHQVNEYQFKTNWKQKTRRTS